MSRQTPLNTWSRRAFWTRNRWPSSLASPYHWSRRNTGTTIGASQLSPKNSIGLSGAGHPHLAAETVTPGDQDAPDRAAGVAPHVTRWGQSGASYTLSWPDTSRGPNRRWSPRLSHCLSRRIAPATLHHSRLPRFLRIEHFVRCSAHLRAASSCGIREFIVCWHRVKKSFLRRNP